MTSTPPPPPARASSAAIVLSTALSVVAFIVWVQQVGGLANLSASDAAGNALAQAYTAIAVIILWLVLAVLAVVAALKGFAPRAAGLAALVLIPVSGVVAMQAQELLSRPGLPPHLWPIIIPAGVPPLVIAFCFWALLPALHRALPARLFATAIWGAVLLLCCAIVPFSSTRNQADEIIVTERERILADYAKLPADAPLWEQLPFLPLLYGDQESELRNRLRKLERRQRDAELMLERGDFPLGDLRAIDLDPTPALCEKARGQLRRSVERLVLKPQATKPYAVIAEQVSGATSAMLWLIGYECPCQAEAEAWENMANAYTGTNFDVVELRRMRDPKEFGRVLRENPERFSMVSSKTHLKAWLEFADQAELHDRALAGARTLDHRTSDAIEMLQDKLNPSAPWSVLKYLPVLNLEPTPALCIAALAQVQQRLKDIYHPTVDDPRPYSELLDRLGAWEPLTALRWLAGNGCAAEAELSEAEIVVRAYRDSSARAAMLAALAQLHRKQ